MAQKKANWRVLNAGARNYSINVVALPNQHD